MILRAASIIALCGLSGCSVLKEVRVFQDEVKKPIQDNVGEGIRQAASYLDREIAPEMGDIDVVAGELSDRVGAPREKAEPAEIIRNLQSERADLLDERDDLNKWLDKRQGTELEGTGLNLTSIGGVAAIVGLIFLMVLVPTSIPLVFQIIQTIAGTSRKVVAGTVNGITKSIDEWGAENPDEMEKLMHRLRDNLGDKEEAVVRKAKSRKL